MPSEPLIRATSVVLPLTEDMPSFKLDAQNKSYKHQYANIYYLRLRLLRTIVEKQATEKWHDLAGAWFARLTSIDAHAFMTGSPKLVPRVLEVTKGQLCFIVGTVYMDMPLKPNVLEDIGRDVRDTRRLRRQCLISSHSAQYPLPRPPRRYSPTMILSAWKTSRVAFGWSASA